MKKNIFVILTTAMILNACTAPPTPMPTATATSTPTIIPSPTTTATLIPTEVVEMGPSFPEGFPREYSDEIAKWGYATEINGDVLMVDWDGDGVLEESIRTFA